MSSSGLQVCGVRDDSISSVLKVWIKQDQRCVCGIIGPGTSRTLTAKWDSPLEQTNVGSQGALSTIADGGQALTGKTTVTTFSSTQIWQGNTPLKFSLNLVLFAQSDAAFEVMTPLQWLEEFASGNVNGTVPLDPKAAIGLTNGSALGRIPDTVTINLGRKIIVPNCVIENITIPLDKEKDKNGNLIRASVQLDIQTKTMLGNQSGPSNIGSTWKTGAGEEWALPGQK